MKINNNINYYNDIYNHLYSKKLYGKSNNKIDWKKVIYPDSKGDYDILFFYYFISTLTLYIYILYIGNFLVATRKFLATF